MGEKGSGREGEWEGRGAEGKESGREGEWEGRGVGGKGSGREGEWEGRGGEGIHELCDSHVHITALPTMHAPSRPVQC